MMIDDWNFPDSSIFKMFWVRPLLSTKRKSSELDPHFREREKVLGQTLTFEKGLSFASAPGQVQISVMKRWEHLVTQMG